MIALYKTNPPLTQPVFMSSAWKGGFMVNMVHKEQIVSNLKRDRIAFIDEPTHQTWKLFCRESQFSSYKLAKYLEADIYSECVHRSCTCPSDCIGFFLSLQYRPPWSNRDDSISVILTVGLRPRVLCGASYVQLVCCKVSPIYE